MEIEERQSLLNQFLKDSGIYFKKDCFLKYDTYFKMGGLVKFLIEPQSCSLFYEVVKYLRSVELEYKVLGATK